jgi:hypothetical protein
MKEIFNPRDLINKQYIKISERWIINDKMNMKISDLNGTLRYLFNDSENLVKLLLNAGNLMIWKNFDNGCRMLTPKSGIMKVIEIPKIKIKL